PDPDAIGIDLGPRLQIAQGVSIVLSFVERKKLGARLALRPAEAPVVDRQCDESGTREGAPVLHERLLDDREAVADHEARPLRSRATIVRQVEIRRAAQPAAIEEDLGFHEHHLLSATSRTPRALPSPIPRLRARAYRFLGADVSLVRPRARKAINQLVG